MKALLAVFLPLVFLPIAFAANPSIALVSKTILDVTRREAGKPDWLKAKRGETLGSGDRVRTGERSIAIIKFMDNSLVRVREKSELVVTGDVDQKRFSKEVNLGVGGIGFNVKKQRTGEEFRFSSPTSVASIRGTRGLFGSDVLGDTLIVREGLVNFLNLVSSDSLNVEAGYIAFSTPDGAISKRKASDQELREADNASRAGGDENHLEFELQDSQGNKKQLHIDYK